MYFTVLLRNIEVKLKKNVSGRLEEMLGDIYV